MMFACQYCDAIATHQAHIAGTSRFLMLCENGVDRMLERADDEAARSREPLIVEEI